MSKRIHVKEEFQPDHPREVLPDGQHVKQRERKVGRPSIFIGSSQESLHVAQKVKACFDPDRYEVDIWNEGVFGKTISTDVEGLSNVEWLKNFTDIYDFALFIFVPEDEIVVKTRTMLHGDEEMEAKTVGTRHNVVFEFGMFLGRIGAKRSFILADRDVEEFIQFFFTDLKENLDDTEHEATRDRFRIEIYRYRGGFKEYVEQQANATDWDDSELILQVERIKKRIDEVFETVEVGFLPSTSLAVGYFNNFVRIFAQNVNQIRSGEELPAKVKEKMVKDPVFVRTVERIQQVKQVKLKIVLPNQIQHALQKDFKQLFPRALFTQRNIPGQSRDLTVDCLRSSYEGDCDTLFFYDVPTTLNSSMKAVEMLTPYLDIKELLFEKERRNFDKTIEYVLSKAEAGESLKLINPRRLDEAFDEHVVEIPNIRDIVSIIYWDDFLAETGQEESGFL